MLVVVAVGGNALLQRGEVPLAQTQEKNVAVAVRALAPLAADHDLVITYGDGPQVGLLANESAADPVLPSPYPLDVLVAQTQGMIGYFLLQGFENALPGRQVASLICQTKVAADDPRSPADQVHRAGLPGGGGPQAGRAPGVAGPAGRLRLATGSSLPRAPGDRGTPGDPHAGR
jgi:carbamate kinase